MSLGRPASEFTSCSECGCALSPFVADPMPTAQARYCGAMCAETAMGREGGWVKVADLDAVQRVELNHMLTPRGEPS